MADPKVVALVRALRDLELATARKEQLRARLVELQSEIGRTHETVHQVTEMVAMGLREVLDGSIPTITFYMEFYAAVVEEERDSPTQSTTKGAVLP